MVRMWNLFRTLEVLKPYLERILLNMFSVQSLKLKDGRRKVRDSIVLISDDRNELEVRVIYRRLEFKLGFEHVILGVLNKV